MTTKETLLLSAAICTLVGLWWAWRSRSRFPTLYARHAVAKSIKKLSEVERANILTQSPLETGAFQGEGFHVWHKGMDWPAGYVTALRCPTATPRIGSSRVGWRRTTNSEKSVSLASGYQHGHALAWVAARQYLCRQNRVAGTVPVTRLRPGPRWFWGNQRTSNAVLLQTGTASLLPFPPASGPRRRKSKTSDPAPGFLSSWFPRGG
jgi:hypothetical protein